MAVIVSFLCSTLIVHSLPVKSGSLDSISDNCSFIEFDDDWDDSQSIKDIIKRLIKMIKRYD